MARAKKKTAQSQYEEELNILEALYLEMSDQLRALRMDKISVEERINDLKTLLIEHENNKDKNRKLFHVITERDSDIEADELREKKFAAEQEDKELSEKIAMAEKKLDAVHVARKVMFSASAPAEPDNLPKPDVPGTPSDPLTNYPACISAGNSPISTGETVSPDSEKDSLQAMSKKEKGSLKRRLSGCIEGLELASRVTAFDPERARIELGTVIDSINEIISRL